MRGFRGQLLTREKQSKRKLQHTSQQLHNEVGTVTPQEERACGAWSRRVYRWGHWKEEERYLVWDLGRKILKEDGQVGSLPHVLCRNPCVAPLIKIALLGCNPDPQRQTEFRKDKKPMEREKYPKLPHQGGCSQAMSVSLNQRQPIKSYDSQKWTHPYYPCHTPAVGKRSLREVWPGCKCTMGFKELRTEPQLIILPDTWCSLLTTTISSHPKQKSQGSIKPT